MAHQGFYTEWIAKDDGKIQIEGRRYPLFFIFFIFHGVCLSLVFNPPEWIAKVDGKIKRGEEGPPPLPPSLQKHHGRKTWGLVLEALSTPSSTPPKASWKKNMGIGPRGFVT